MPTRTSGSPTEAPTAAGAKGTKAKTPTIGDRSRTGRVRRDSKRKWVFETCPEYPTGDEWEKYFEARSKEHVLSVAIQCQLKGWVKEWFEE